MSQPLRVLIRILQQELQLSNIKFFIPTNTFNTKMEIYIALNKGICTLSSLLVHSASHSISINYAVSFKIRIAKIRSAP